MKDPEKGDYCYECGWSENHPSLRFAKKVRLEMGHCPKCEGARTQHPTLPGSCNPCDACYPLGPQDRRKKHCGEKTKG